MLPAAVLWFTGDASMGDDEDYGEGEEEDMEGEEEDEEDVRSSLLSHSNTHTLSLYLSFYLFLSFPPFFDSDQVDSVVLIYRMVTSSQHLRV